MAAAACGMQLMLSTLLTQSFGAYVAVLSQERGWSKTALAGAAALQSVESAIMGPVLGYAMDRFGPQRMIRMGIAVFGLGFIGLSQIDSLGGFYLCAVLLAIGASLGGYFPLSVALIQWFERYRARALSMVSLGLALGGLLVPLVAWCMQHFGWRNTALGSGLLAMLIGLPLASVIRRRPQDHGETVDGLPPAPAPDPGSATGAEATRSPEFSASQALRTRAFWLLALGHGLALLVVTAVNVHAITHLKEGLGYSVPQAALAIMLMTVGQLAGVGLGMLLGDRYEKRFVAALCMLGHASGLLLLAFATHALEVAAFALLHGMAWGLRGPFMQAIRADYFGRHAIGVILGLSAAVTALGQIGGPMIAGLLADLTGNYRWGFSLLALAAASGSVVFVLARPPRLPGAGVA
ncbi:MAG: MFS transporter [Rhodoferax sp.]|nr:MFS transporter [Rhodoferax sp.]